MPDKGSDLVKKLAKRGAAVPKFMSPLFSKGYYLYVDNCYTSKNFTYYFFENGTLMWYRYVMKIQGQCNEQN